MIDVKVLMDIENTVTELMDSIDNPLVQTVPMLKKAVKNHLNSILRDIDAARLKEANEPESE